MCARGLPARCRELCTGDLCTLYRVSHALTLSSYLPPNFLIILCHSVHRTTLCHNFGLGINSDASQLPFNFFHPSSPLHHEHKNVSCFLHRYRCLLLQARQCGHPWSRDVVPKTRSFFSVHCVLSARETYFSSHFLRPLVHLRGRTRGL